MGSVAHASSSITRTASFTYDPSTGLLTSETIEPNSTTASVTTNYTYDSYGNKTVVTVSGTGIATRSTTTTYDSQGEFVTQVENALGQTEQWTYSPSFGEPTVHTGPNGLTTYWAYDTLGRKSTEQSPDGSYSLTGYSYGQYDGALSAYLIITEYNTGSGVQSAPTTDEYYDTLGREIKNQVQTAETVAGVSNVQVNYNALGQVASKSLQLSGTGPLVTYTYDQLGRVLTVTNPADGSIAGATTSYTYNGLTTTVTVTNPSGTNGVTSTSTTTTNNDQGLPIQVKDTNGSAVNYAYDALGNLTFVNNPNLNTIAYVYDNEGRKIQMVDPDRGTWNYAYDALGELTSQTDGRGTQSTFSYDLLGRLVTRVQGQQTDKWTYDTASYGVGKLASETVSGAAGNVIGERAFAYDTLSRPVTTSFDLVQPGMTPGATYTYMTGTISTSYDAASRINTVTYASGYTVQYNYSTIGTLQSLSGTPAGSTTAQTLWTDNVNNGFFAITQETFGNGVVQNNTYDAATRLLTGVQAGVGGGSAVANFTYGYDALSNLTRRSDANEGLSESFGYDDLYRLTSDTLTNSAGTAVQSMAYDAQGDITSKSDVGTYNYGGTGVSDYSGGNGIPPHAMASITSNNNQPYNVNTSYTYDADGNMLTGLGRTVTWTAFNMVSTLQGAPTNGIPGGALFSYHYDADNQRLNQFETGATGHYTSTFYFNDPTSGLRSEYTEAETGSSQNLTTTSSYWTDYLSVNGQLIGIHVTPVIAATTGAYNRYFTLDHLGSVAVITDDSGNVVERDSYDAWGQRRLPTGQDSPNANITSTTTRGYTSQEEIQDAGLVNSNARIYDPIVGRFFSPDPLEQTQGLQILNPYSYILNNPLSGTDPTGMCGGILGIIICPILHAASAIGSFLKHNPILGDLYVVGSSIACSPFGLGPVCGASAAGQVAFLETGRIIPTLEAEAITFAEAEAFQAVGSFTDGVNGGGYGSGQIGQALNGGAVGTGADYLAQVAGDGLVGGLSSLAEGGSFESGFLAAGFAGGANPLVQVLQQNGDDFAALVAHSLIGGAGSELGGGSFANGAETGSFEYLFNALGGKIVGGAAGVAASAACDAATDGACAPADGEIVEGSANAGSALQDLISGSNLFKSAYNLVQYVRTGDFATAVKDFLSLGPENVRPLPNPDQPGGLLGDLPDGSTANVRPNSTFGPDNSPTLEIQNPPAPRLKFRYNQ